ncbi:LuxR C-terminal-related transcriptional regulator [Streptomyces sp. HD]|uniref:LuxR C-terminal-related transcriptional regulator n=1 Tax=Streptomyces sp. HD TaxID=3020892 RepID=UPI00232FB24F|nr:response regulator transcription factor [Streptomyces sp. HD]MDC0768697.1 response regulator transcription factor [Streptomyces sp. HD]
MMDDFRALEVMLVDNEDLVRRGFRQALGEEPDITVVADTRVGEEALRMAELRRPQVILVDAECEFVRKLARPLGTAVPGVAPGIIVLTSNALDSHLLGSLKAGARGFLLKSASQDELISAVRAVADGAAFLCPTMTRRLIDRFEILPPPHERSHAVALASLSGRETQVLCGIAMGRSNQEIAHELHVTLATVKSHVSRILAKLELPNRMHAALMAQRSGLVHLPQPPRAKQAAAGPLSSGRPSRARGQAGLVNARTTL